MTKTILVAVALAVLGMFPFMGIPGYFVTRSLTRIADNFVFA